MAQLPPKVPTLPQDWSSFPHQTISSYLSNTVTTKAETTTTTDSNHHQASWVDGFLDFTAARRGTHHHRSISDSVTYFETKGMMQLVEDCNKNDNIINNNMMTGFERFDEDQLMSMFSDSMSSFVPLHPWNPSSPSDQNSNNDDEKPQAMLSDDQFESQFQEPLHQQDQEQLPQAKIEPGLEEEEISCKQEPQHPPPNSFNGESVIDPKRVKRILANRQSAQRSRVRKLHYISELERTLTTLQTEVSTLSPRVAFLDHQRLILNMDNSALKQRIAALAQDNIFKDAHQEALKKEIERLRQVYNQQNLNNNNICSTASKPC